MKELFKQHFELRLKQTSDLMVENSVDNLIIESGFPTYYYLDDQTTPFHSNPYFLFFCPDGGQGHILHLTPGKKPKLFYYIPNDIWHETSQLKGDFWEDAFEIVITENVEEAWKNLNLSGNSTHIGPQNERALRSGCTPLSTKMSAQLNWIRTTKTNYELECIRLANKKASLGHMAAKKAFLDGKSELGIFEDYLQASNQREIDLPYGAIIGLDEKAAVLHYQNLRNEGKGKTFLIDAGARHNGYCSDISRTYFTNEVHPVFKEIHEKMDLLQKELCKLISPNRSYIDVQVKTMEGVARIACDTGIITSNFETAVEKNLSDYFFPHGVGHPLGLQVHDVGGKQTDEIGTPGQPNENYKYLRTLRDIQNNDVLTVEPGFYFIPKHLESVKGSNELAPLFNWELIEELVPFGGIRIEDNVVATQSGPVNITREFLPE